MRARTPRDLQITRQMIWVTWCVARPVLRLMVGRPFAWSRHR